MTPRQELIAAREQAGLSRAELGKAISISRIHVYRVEKDLVDPSPNLMRRWAKALGESVTDIWPERDFVRVKRHIKEGTGLLAEARRAA